jgi:hypothetical protein
MRNCAKSETIFMIYDRGKMDERLRPETATLS